MSKKSFPILLRFQLPFNAKNKLFLVAKEVEEIDSEQSEESVIVQVCKLNICKSRDASNC